MQEALLQFCDVRVHAKIGACVPVGVHVCAYALLTAVCIMDSKSGVRSTTPVTSPSSWMVGLIVINNQLIHGPCVTAEFLTDEPSFVCV